MKNILKLTFIFCSIFQLISFDSYAATSKVIVSQQVLLKSVKVKNQTASCYYKGNKWISGKKSVLKGKTYFQSFDKKSADFKKFNAKCVELVAPTVVKSLSSLPDISSLVSASSLGDSSSRLVGKTISGTPPALSEISSLSVKDVFWRPGVVDHIVGGSPTQQECNEFFAGNVDGASGGQGACSMAEGVGHAFEQIQQSGSSLCYMKNAPSQAAFDAGAVKVLRGKLPGGKIENLFSTPEASARVVQINISGQEDGGDDNSDEGPSEDRTQSGFIKVFPSDKTYQYRAVVYFCREGLLNNISNFKIKNDGSFESLDTDGDSFSAFVQASLTREDGSLAFDNTRNRYATVNALRGEQSFKAQMAITSDNLLLVKQRDDFHGSSNRNFSISSFSGTGVDDISFLEGAYKQFSSQQEHTFEFQGAAEYRDSFYAASTTNHLLENLSAVNLSTDSFYADPAEGVSIDPDDYPCDATPDITVSLDMGSVAMEPVRQLCEPRLKNMYFCHEDDAVESAQSNYGNSCGFGG